MTWAELNIEAEYRRVWKAARSVSRRLSKSPAPLTLRRKKGSSRTSGYAAFNGSRVVLTIGDLAPIGDVLGLIVHEIAHPARGCQPTGGSRKRAIHDDAFWTVVSEITFGAYGIDLPVLRGPAHEKHRQACEALATIEEPAR